MRFIAPLAALAVATSLLSACSIFREPEAPARPPPPTRAPVPAPPSAAQPQPGGTPPTAQPVVPEPPQRAPQKQFKLSPATAALVSQARTQARSGNYEPAAGTLERALRIEPENPLLWIELGQVRLSEGNAGQADSMGRKALAQATGDPQAQASAWRLIADSLRALNRNQEAAEADRKAGSLSPR
ncbi:MAG TPA: tetratricopeptide repeat protein [Steroidobacteraceae bacterium]|nr:tetratricopeptide repeat protein [Steroidobacteraceae bacterium]